jgi:hypothetical protein
MVASLCDSGADVSIRLRSYNPGSEGFQRIVTEVSGIPELVDMRAGPDPVLHALTRSCIFESGSGRLSGK